MRLFILLCACLLASGCKAIHNPPPEWPWAKKENKVCAEISDKKGCDLADVVQAYNLALEYCIAYSNKYENGGDTINGSRFAIATLGTLSGAVFAPLAGGSAKDAWSGLSGSTNALQSSLDESFSNAINVRRRLEISNAGAIVDLKVGEVKDASDKVLAAMRLAYECRMASARADGAAIQALNNLQAGAGVVQSNKTAAEHDPAAAKAEAERKAKEASEAQTKKLADAAAATSSPANPADKAAIQNAQTAISAAATAAAAPAAAAAATDAAQQVPAAAGTPATIQQTQVTAQIAAQVAAGSAAQTAVDAKVAELINTAKNDVVKKAILEMAAPTVEAAASSAANAAAASAAAPIQPLDGLK